MSMEPVTGSLEETPETTAAFPVALKKILETPPPNLFSGEAENDKEKFSADDVDGGGGVSGLGPSAALTPAIWEKTIPYDGETFHLEYMDLEEFLMENGISASVEEAQEKALAEEPSQQTLKKPPAIIPKTEPTPSAPVSLLPIIELDQCEEEIITTTTSSDSTETKTGIITEQSTPEPVIPEDVHVEVNFEPDPTDLVLSSVPGGELFDPRKHRFTEEELKPQPMIKKAKKILVPEEQKDDKYWQRRKKNNVAAKRSRDARRLKENQITVRAAFLERENTALRMEVVQLRKDYGCCKNIVARYEAKYGPI